MTMESILVEMFHDPVRVGHAFVYKILERDRNSLFEKIMNDYKVKPMDRYELEKMILTPHYLKLEFPTDKDENYECVTTHARKKYRMVS